MLHLLVANDRSWLIRLIDGRNFLLGQLEVNTSYEFEVSAAYASKASKQYKRTNEILEFVDTSSPDDWRSNEWLGERPGESHLSHTDAAFLSNGSDPLGEQNSQFYRRCGGRNECIAFD